MIVVTGATGQLGRLVITELLNRVPASEVVAATRHPENVIDLSEIGVRVRLCDYDNPATLVDAFEPGDRVLLISSNDFVNSVSQHTAVVEAARASDVSLLAYTSLLNAAQSRLIVAQPHRATEPVIRQSGVPYTLLRNNLYSEHFAPFVQQALRLGTFADLRGHRRRTTRCYRRDPADAHRPAVHDAGGDVGRRPAAIRGPARGLSYLGSIVARPSSTRSSPRSKPCLRRSGSCGARASRTTRVRSGKRPLSIRLSM
jgi:uncharacterized protein YbjT (DUF2867 family)